MRITVSELNNNDGVFKYLGMFFIRLQQVKYRSKNIGNGYGKLSEANIEIITYIIFCINGTKTNGNGSYCLYTSRHGLNRIFLGTNHLLFRSDSTDLQYSLDRI